MLRLLYVSGLVAVSLTASGAAVAQSLPLGSIIDAIGRGQGAAPAPEAVPLPRAPHGKAAPASRGSGARAKPVRRPYYEEPGESGRTPPGYLLGNG